MLHRRRRAARRVRAGPAVAAGGRARQAQQQHAGAAPRARARPGTRASARSATRPSARFARRHATTQVHVYFNISLLCDKLVVPRGMSAQVFRNNVAFYWQKNFRHRFSRRHY